MRAEDLYTTAMLLSCSLDSAVSVEKGRSLKYYIFRIPVQAVRKAEKMIRMRVQ